MFDEMSNDILETFKEYEESIFDSSYSNIEEEDFFEAVGIDYDLNFLGVGAFRVVYELNQDKVIKFIKLSTVKDNEHEFKRWLKSNKSSLLPIHYNHAPDFKWIIVEKLDNIEGNNFLNLFNKTFGFNFKSNKQIYKELGNETFNNLKPLKITKKYLELKKLVNETGLGIDFTTNNFGIRKSTGELVIRDFAIEDYGSDKLLENLMFKNNVINKIEELSNQQIINKKHHIKLLKNIFGEEKYLGSGQNRATFEYENNKIIKIALFQSKGNNSNKTEWENSQCLKNENLCFVNYYDVDKINYEWLIGEKVKPIKTEEELMHYAIKLIPEIKILSLELNTSEFHIFRLLLTVGNLIINNIPLKEHIKKRYEKTINLLLQNNIWFKQLFEGVKKCFIDIHDIHEENFGLREKDNTLVFLDYESLEEET